METENLEFHEIANLFPLLDGQDRDDLVENMKMNGFNPRFPIILYQGKILDGRNRYLASKAANIQACYVAPKDIKNPFAEVATANLHRRHLSMEKRAFIASAMANMKSGYRADLSPIGDRSLISRTRAVEIMQVSETSFDRARFIERHGVAELTEKAKNGELALSAAEEIAKLPKAEQAAALTKAPKKNKNRSGTLRKRTSTKRKKETYAERQMRSLELTTGKKIGISKEEFDPDFKGSPLEFADQHGYVQIMTKAELEVANDQAAFSAWVGAIRSLRAPLQEYLSGKKFKPENFHAWIKKAKSPEKRMAEIKELASLIVRTRESIDWLLPLLEAKQTNGDHL